MGKLDGKTAVVTGATSGLALASAKSFADEGAHVFITGRRKETLDEAVATIGHNVTGVQADSASLADLDRLFELVKREKGAIDVLFASAGHAEAAPLGAITEELFDRIFDLNTRGTLFTVQKALPLLTRGASVLLTGSMSSVKGWPGASVYSASKAALRSFARTWLVELKDRDIRVNVLSPGAIDTPAMEANGPEAKQFYEAMIPRGQMGRSSEIATAALFLASGDSSFVNGIELFVDGGVGQI
ncbi:SDR family oxidoreductase [Streptomyces mirabilis]